MKHKNEYYKIYFVKYYFNNYQSMDNVCKVFDVRKAH